MIYKRDACAKVQEKEDFLWDSSELSWLQIYSSILTFESLYQVLREILLGLDWKQLTVVIKSMAFGIWQIWLGIQVHPSTNIDLGRKSYSLGLVFSFVKKKFQRVIVVTEWEDVYFSSKNMVFAALADVSQWIEHQPANWKVAGLIPSQGTCLGFRPGPQLGMCERQTMGVSLTYRCFFPSLSSSLPLSLKVN